MVLKVIASGSSGNAYALVDDDGILLIEAGVPLQEVYEAINYNAMGVLGCLVSHSHGDHAKYIEEYIKSGIPIVTNHEYAVYLKDKYPYYMIQSGMASFDGIYSVATFDCIHDVPCVGFVIKNKSMGKLLFVTDTEYLKYRFEGINNIMVEANYSQEIIDENMNDGNIPKSLRDRIMKSHMSIETAKGVVEANKSAVLRNVVMLHLSGHNSDGKNFKEEMQKVAGEFCNVEIAKRGVEINIDLTPF